MAKYQPPRPPRPRSIRLTPEERRAVGGVALNIGRSAYQAARGKSERGTTTGRTLKKFIRHNLGKGKRGTTTGVAISDAIDSAKRQVRKVKTNVRRTVSRVRKRFR